MCIVCDILIKTAHVVASILFKRRHNWNPITETLFKSYKKKIDPLGSVSLIKLL